MNTRHCRSLSSKAPESWQQVRHTHTHTYTRGTRTAARQCSRASLMRRDPQCSILFSRCRHPARARASAPQCYDLCLRCHQTRRARPSHPPCASPAPSPPPRRLWEASSAALTQPPERALPDARSCSASAVQLTQLSLGRNMRMLPYVLAHQLRHTYFGGMISEMTAAQRACDEAGGEGTGQGVVSCPRLFVQRAVAGAELFAIHRDHHAHPPPLSCC